MRLWLFMAGLVACGSDNQADPIDTDTSDSDPDTDTETDADTDTDTDTDTETDTDTDSTPSAVIERNFSPMCSVYNQLYPGVGEEGHWAASRITPSNTPFTLEKVVIEVSDDAFCDGGQSFTAEVWIETALSPSASPTVLERFDLPAASPAGGLRSLEATLSTPVMVDGGEHIFISLQLADDSACIRTCADAGAIDRNYWSSAVTPPFSWVTLQSFGIQSDLIIEAHGFH
jgi:hypothetical protein